MSPSTSTHDVTVLKGDGIGPEIMDATLRVLEAFDVAILPEICAAGEKVTLGGDPTGVPLETLESIERTGVVLKGPFSTQTGAGANSINVYLRQLFELYANIRPAYQLPEAVRIPFPGKDISIVTVRENVEDLYAGIEYNLTPTYAEALKLVSIPGSERVIRTAFELAIAEGKSKVTCAHKGNILKQTEGTTFADVFAQVARDYPQIESDYIIVDNLLQQLVIRPESFQVIVLTNMNGDLVSDMCGGLVGGIGVSASANLGTDAAMFEAVHGSWPQAAGQNKANPTALILSSVMMCRALGEVESARDIYNSIMSVLERGEKLTADLHREGGRSQLVGTQAFADEVIRLRGERPSERWAVENFAPFPDLSGLELTVQPTTGSDKFKPLLGPSINRGVDIFFESKKNASRLGEELQKASGPSGRLEFLATPSVVLDGSLEKNHDRTSDLWRVRYISSSPQGFSQPEILNIQGRLLGIVDRICSATTLLEIDGHQLFRKAQGQR